MPSEPLSGGSDRALETLLADFGRDLRRLAAEAPPAGLAPWPGERAPSRPNGRLALAAGLAALAFLVLLPVVYLRDPFAFFGVLRTLLAALAFLGGAAFFLRPDWAAGADRRLAGFLLRRPGERAALFSTASGERWLFRAQGLYLVALSLLVAFF